MRLRLIAPALIYAAAACSAHTTDSPPGIQALQDQRRAVIDKIGSDTLQPLSLWQQEAPPSCASPLLAKARDSVLVTASLITPDREGVDMVVESGSWILRVADAARQHRCKDVARDLYETVIATYTGAAYAALRQRAQIGIEDLRQ